MYESVSTAGHGQGAGHPTATQSSISAPCAAREDGTGAIVIHDLDSDVLADPDGFDRAWMLGTWNVAWSTLPMWKSKRDVTITYAQRADTTPAMQIMDSDVAYSPASSSTTSPSHVKGTERLTSGGTGFTWRGDGWLAFVTSKWWVRGWGERDGVEWMFIYFTKTLFTPQGVDVLLRPSPSASAAQVAAVRDAVVAQVRAQLGSEAETGFEVATTAREGLDG